MKFITHRDLVNQTRTYQVTIGTNGLLGTRWWAVIFLIVNYSVEPLIQTID